MPRYKFHANVEASIPSAPGTQLMSCTNYEAVADFAGHWLHRAQASLLTGAIGQIKLSHIRKKTLVRAWCGPGLPVTGPSNMFTYVLADALVQWLRRRPRS